MPQSKEQKQQTAKKLIQDRQQRTPQQQLDLLDSKLGVGVGAKKERNRLAKLIAK